MKKTIAQQEDIVFISDRWLTAVGVTIVFMGLAVCVSNRMLLLSSVGMLIAISVAATIKELIKWRLVSRLRRLHASESYDNVRTFFVDFGHRWENQQCSKNPDKMGDPTLGRFAQEAFAAVKVHNKTFPRRTFPDAGEDSALIETILKAESVSKFKTAQEITKAS